MLEAGCQLQQVLIGEMMGNWGGEGGWGGRRLLGIRFPSATLSSVLTLVLGWQCSPPFLLLKRRKKAWAFVYLKA